MGRLLIIGIDGLDFDYVQSHLHDLKTFERLSRIGCLQPLRSVFPPDSIPAWVTIFTGKSPAEHGIVDSVDYLEKDFHKFGIDNSTYRGRTFWDVVGAAGFRVCVVNPFISYPAWEVNGSMVSGPVFLGGETDCFPKDLLDKYPDAPPLGGIVDTPDGADLQGFVQKTHADAEKLAQFTNNMLSEEDWDLAFVSFFTMDRIQHFLWRFCDADDPTYPGPNEHEGSIDEHYRRFDGIVGELLASLSEDDRIVVISDHGHGMRCTKTINLNEFLRQKGYLKDECGRFRIFSRKYWLEKAKNNTLRFLYFLGQEELVYKFGRFVPNRKKLKTAEHVFKRDKSLAWVPKFAGCGPYGGIEIARNLSPEVYEKTCDSIIRDLEELNRDQGGALFKWIRRRDFVQGDGANYLYPDILFELDPQYGANWSLFVPLVSKNYFHRRLSGGHKWHGVFASNFTEKKTDLEVTDIFGVVCEHFGVGP